PAAARGRPAKSGRAANDIEEFFWVGHRVSGDETEAAPVDRIDRSWFHPLYDAAAQIRSPPYQVGRRGIDALIVHCQGSWLLVAGLATSRVELDSLFPVLVESRQRLLECLVAILGRDGLDRVAPGCRLAKEVLDLGDVLLDLGDLALEVGRLAIGE